MSREDSYTASALVTTPTMMATWQPMIPLIQTWQAISFTVNIFDQNDENNYICS